MPTNIDANQDTDINIQTSKSDDDFDPIKNYYGKELVTGPKQVSQALHYLQKYCLFTLFSD